MKLKQTDPTVVFAEVETTDLLLFLISDAHLDSVHCDRKRFINDIKRAYSMGAWIAFAGDVFDAMQGKFDPRRSMDELRPEYRREDYFDFVVEDIAGLLSPYADRIILIGLGNHETAVLKNNNTDLTERLIYILRHEYGSPVLKGSSSYAGWLIIRMMQGNTSACPPVKIRYAHSAGGGSAPVTRGVIQTNRQAVYLPDADVVWNGHNHEGYTVPIARERVTIRGKVRRDVAWFIRTPGYKQEITKKKRGFGVEKISSPKPIGSVMLHLYVATDVASRADRLRIEPTPWIR